MAVLQKDRRANEFRAQAETLRAELLDPAKTFTGDELKTKGDAIAALEQRAALVGGFTADAEITDQGGTATLVRVDSPESRGSDREMTAVERDRVSTRIDRHRTNVRRHFSGVTAYLRAANGQTNGLTEQQRAVLAEGAILTRTIVGTASDASGGEFLLPLEQDNSLFRIDNMIPGLAERARRYVPKGRTFRIPYVVQTNGNLTRPLSSISAITIVGEGSAKPVQEPVFAQRLMTVYKYAALSQVGDETLEDDLTGELQPALIDMVGGEVSNQINFDVTIAGTGTSQPTGALHTSANTALIKVTRALLNKIGATDVFNMYAAHTHGPKSFWLVSRSALAQIMALTLSGTTLVTYLPNLNNNPTGAQLLGYPLVVSDFMNTLGSESDFALINPDFYAFGARKQLTVESSIHYAFNTDVTTWRFLARAGGIPIPTASYAYRSVASSKVDAHSPFVTLDDVYV